MILRGCLLSILVSLINPETATAKSCAKIFREVESEHTVTSLIQSHRSEIERATHFRPESFYSNQNFLDNLYSRNDIAAASTYFLKLTRLQKSQLIAMMRTSDRVFLSPFGFSLFNEVQWNGLKLLMETGVFEHTGAIHAQKFMEVIATNLDATIPGLSVHWVQQLRQSYFDLSEIHTVESQRVKDNALQSLRGFAAYVMSPLAKGSSKYLNSATSDSRFVFPWGLSTSHLHQMTPNHALIVMRMLLHLSLIENLVSFQEGVISLGRRHEPLHDNIQLVAALNPQLIPIIDVFYSNPINVNVNSAYHKNQLSGAVDFIRFPFRKWKQDFVLDSQIKDGRVSISFRVPNELKFAIDPRLFNIGFRTELIVPILDALGDVVRETREVPPPDLYRFFEIQIFGNQRVDIQFPGLTPTETVLVTLRLQEILE